MTVTTKAAALTLVLAGLACGGEPEGDGMGDTPMADRPMGGMAMPSMEMLPAMQAWADTLRTAAPNTLPGLLAGHAPRVETMLTAMAADMGAMSMTGDEAWRAIEDSIRADLAAFPGLDGETLVLRARAHAGRLRRLMAQHEMMMQM